MSPWLAASILSLAAAGEPVSVPRFEEVMAEVAHAWSTQDTARALECFTADALYMQPPDRQLYRGVKELERLFDGLQPDTVMAFQNLAFNPKTQVGFGEFSFGRAGTGRAVHGVVVVELENGRIASWREYFEDGPEAFADFVAVAGKDWKWTVEDLQ